MLIAQPLYGASLVTTTEKGLLPSCRNRTRYQVTHAELQDILTMRKAKNKYNGIFTLTLTQLVKAVSRRTASTRSRKPLAWGNGHRRRTAADSPRMSYPTNTCTLNATPAGAAPLEVSNSEKLKWYEDECCWYGATPS